MATGRLGAVDLLAGVTTALYTVPVNTLTSVNLNICNRNITPVLVRIAIINGPIGSLLNSDFIEYDTSIISHGVLERTGIVIQAGYTLAVISDTANVSASCWGFEDSTL